jgi:hypothetical protein
MRSKTLLIAASTVVALLLVPVSLWAHHAFAAEFDASKPVSLKGKVVKMDWINPHAWIHIEVPSADGKVVRWMIEAAAPNAMLRRGFNQDSLPIGTEIVVAGFRAKDGANRANGSSITYPDGKKLFIGSQGTGAPEEQNR